jgi:lysophospholipase
MDLLGIVENQIPRGPRAGYFEGRDGHQLRFARWRPSVDTCRGTVCLFTGRGEFIEKYFETIQDLRRRGFAVATMDWRGQGRSKPRGPHAHKGHIASFRLFDDDLRTFMDQVVLPDCPPPFFALAHSMGANVVLRVMSDYAWFTRVVALAPLVALVPRRLPSTMVRWLADLISALGLGAIYVSGRGPLPAEQFPFAGNLYTSDSRRFERNRKILEQDPGLGVGGPTLGWLSAAFKAMDQLQDKEFPTHIKVPVLVVSAGHDRVIVNQALERLVSHLPAGKLVTIDGARHEILMEKDIYREQFWAAFDAFIPGAAGERHGFRTSSAAS